MHVCWEYFVNWHVLISSAFLYPHLVVNTFIDRSVESVHVLFLVTPVSLDTSRNVSFVQTRVYKRLLGRVFPVFLNFAFIDSQLYSINPVRLAHVGLTRKKTKTKKHDIFFVLLSEWRLRNYWIFQIWTYSLANTK